MTSLTTAPDKQERRSSGPGISNEEILGSGRVPVRKFGTSIETTIFIVVALVLHALYLTTQTSSSSPPQLPTTTATTTTLTEHPISVLQTEDELHHPKRPSMPALFIYRRTRKTGSSSMVNALLRELQPLGYVGLKEGEHEVEPVVRNEFIRPNPRRLFVVHHNQVTKSAHPLRSAVIADTVRDGFATITSYCRQKLHISNCDRASLMDCLQHNDTKNQILYRYVNRTEEDSETYIDLPLSSRHPGLSTTVMRTVFPNVTLQVDLYNVHESACPREEVHEDVKKLYDEEYQLFEQQTITLRKRILGIAGYPFVFDKKDAGSTPITLDEMLDAAEKTEREKYDLKKAESVRGKPSEIIDLLKAEQIWERNRNGKLVLAPQRKMFQ